MLEHMDYIETFKYSSETPWISLFYGFRACEMAEKPATW